MAARLIVVMGPSGSGKTSVGIAMAGLLDVPFLDADSLHPPSNVAKMAAGTPLTDEDRWPWLDAVGEHLVAAGPTGLVIACSALRRAYRERILGIATAARFVELTGSRELLAKRMGSRVGHFMPTSLLDSQLRLLEPLADDEPGVRVEITPGVPEIAAAAIEALDRVEP